MKLLSKGQFKKESVEQRKKRTEEIIRRLKKKYPHAKIALKFSNNWELFAAVVLSAQCTDKKVNEVTARLFKKYRTLNDYLSANSREFENMIRPTGFYRAKTKNILASARIVKQKFLGKIPRAMEEMLTLPGVARKTANVVLGNAYGVVEGMAVDTHMIRLNQKLGFTKENDPVKIEKDLMQIIPKKEWFNYTYRIIDYGRQVCPARHKKCECEIYKIR
jgi:endonuclease-3